MMVRYLVAAAIGASAWWLAVFFWLSRGDTPGPEELLAVAVVSAGAVWVGTKLRARRRP